MPGIEFDLLSKKQRRHLKKIYPGNALQLILKIVCEYYEITEMLIRTRRRDRHIVWPRQVYFFLCSKNTHFSLKRIGESMGGMDHTSVIHSIDTVKDIIATDHKMKDQLLQLQNMVSNVIA